MGSKTDNTEYLEKFQVVHDVNLLRRKRMPGRPPHGPAGFRGRREALGLTGRQLADLAGISGCALSYVERGAAQHCGERAIRAIDDQLVRLEALRRSKPVHMTGADLLWLNWLETVRPVVRRNVAAIVAEAHQ